MANQDNLAVAIAATDKLSSHATKEQDAEGARLCAVADGYHERGSGDMPQNVMSKMYRADDLNEQKLVV